MPDNEVSALEVLRELHAHKEAYIASQTAVGIELDNATKQAELAVSQASQALDLFRALNPLSAEEVQWVKDGHQRTKDEIADSRDLDKQFRVALWGILATGILGAFVWPVIEDAVRKLPL